MKTKTKKVKNAVRNVIVRTYSAGVFAGELKEYDRKTQHAVVLNARRIYYWSGAATLSQLSQEGTKDPSNCKFPAAVPQVELPQVIEILPLSNVAKASIDAVNVWKL